MNSRSAAPSRPFSPPVPLRHSQDAGAAQPASSVVAHGRWQVRPAANAGTEKIYSKTKLAHSPDDQLVRARDGKCGLTGKGYKGRRKTTLRAWPRAYAGR